MKPYIELGTGPDKGKYYEVSSNKERHFIGEFVGEKFVFAGNYDKWPNQQKEIMLRWIKQVKIK